MSDEVVDAQVRAALQGHTDVCTERYGNLWDAVKELKETFNADRMARAQIDMLTHQRFNTISNRMFTILCGVCAASVSGLGIVVFTMLQRGQHP